MIEQTEQTVGMPVAKKRGRPAGVKSKVAVKKVVKAQQTKSDREVNLQMLALEAMEAKIESLEYQFAQCKVIITYLETKLDLT